MCRIITFANRKGGCGKTTTAVNVAHGLAADNSVLFIDMDAQAHASIILSYSNFYPPPPLQTPTYADLNKQHDLLPNQQPLKNDNPLNNARKNSSKSSIVQLLDHKTKIGQIIEKTRIKGLSIIRSSRDLGAWELVAGAKKNSATALAEQFTSEFKQYDFIIIDTPPTLGILMVASLVATKEVYIPMPMHFLAMEGLAEMVQIIYRLNAGFNPDLRLAGIIPTFYNKKTKTARKIKEEIITNFGHHMLLPGIRNNIKLAESPAFKQTIFEYSPKSIGAEDYKKLVTAIKKVRV